jgi:transporter family protein
MWWIFALLSAFFASLTAIFAKQGLSGIDSDLATAVRMIVVVIIAWLITLFKGNFSELFSLSGHNLLFLALSGAATGLSWIFYFKALQIGKVSQVAPVDKLSVVMTIGLSALILKETITFKVAVGALLILIGALVLIA